jgi:hypothetical protein
VSARLTEAALIRYIRERFGEPVIVCELEDEFHIKPAIEQALDIYASYKPVERIGSFTVLAAKQNYVFTEAQCGRGIIEFFKPDLLRQPISLEQFDVFKYHTHLPNLDPGDYFMERVWWEEVRRSAGSDDDWDFIQDPVTGGGTLYLNPIPSASFQAGFIFVKTPTLNEVPATDDQWLRDYTLAICKEILGRIRGKFDGIDGQESALKMDAATLLSESKDDRERLEERLQKRGQIVAPIRG